MTGPRVGLVGVGNMGLPMALRMLDCGIELAVCDRNPDACTSLLERGVEVALTPRALADVCQIVVASMPSREASLAVATGEEGVVAGRALRVYIETSTLGSQAIDRIADALAARGIGLLDAPVSGGPPGARAGSLAVLVSGAQSDFDRCRALLDIMGSKVFYLGAKPGMSQVAKLINNHVSAAGRVAVFEGLAMGIKAGMDPKTLNDVFNAGSARNYTTTDKVPAAILTGLFKFNGPLAIGLKDEALLLEEPRRCNAPLWLAPRILEVSSLAEIEGLVLASRRAFGAIDILINNAVSRHMAPVETFDPRHWDQDLAVNLTAAFNLVRLSLADMKAAGWGRIVNISSNLGLFGAPNRVSYVTTKTALIGLTRAIATETTGTDVTCNAICPSSMMGENAERPIVEIEQTEGLSREGATEKFLARRNRARFVTTVPAMVSFLCSESGKDMSGAIIPMDLGSTAGRPVTAVYGGCNRAP